MLNFLLDYAEGSDVVGRLRVGNVSPIEVEGAYLDSWLAGLLECMSAVKGGAIRYEVDLVEEAIPLVVSGVDGELSMRFGDQVTKLGPIEPAVGMIAAAARELLQKYPLENEALAGEIESRLRTLAGSAANEV